MTQSSLVKTNLAAEMLYMHNYDDRNLFLKRENLQQHIINSCSIDEEEVNHMTTVESVVTEIGLPHPIVYDIYNLCDYVKKEKLNYFTVSILKESCTLFELPFKSRNSKAVLMSKIKEMTHKCWCAVEG